MTPHINLAVHLTVGFTMVFLSLTVLQMLCWIISAAARAAEHRFPSLKGKDLTQPQRVASAAISSEPAFPVSDPNFVSVQNTTYIDRPTLLAIIEEAVQEAYPGKHIRILSYGLPRVIEGAAGWTQAGKQIHFGSHKIR